MGIPGHSTHSDKQTSNQTFNDDDLWKLINISQVRGNSQTYQVNECKIDFNYTFLVRLNYTLSRSLAFTLLVP